MTVSQLKTKKFESLKTQWYKKLKKEGFKDIENPKGNLIKFESTIWKSTKFHKTADSMMLRQARESYFRLAGHFLYDHEFETSTDKAIWTMHANGKTLDHIKTFCKDLTRDKVYHIILKLKHKMYKLYKEV